MNAPPTKPLAPLAPLAPSAFDAEVRRRREEMKTWPDDEVWACQDLLGKLDEKLLSEERQRRLAVWRESAAYVAAVDLRSGGRCEPSGGRSPTLGERAPRAAL